MLGKVQGMEAGAVPILADEQVGNPLHWLREPSPYLSELDLERAALTCLIPTPLAAVSPQSLTQHLRTP